jgi:hypothetical protein
MSCMTQRDPFEHVLKRHLANALLLRRKWLVRRRRLSEARIEAVHGRLHDLATRLLGPNAEPTIGMAVSRACRR